jgi:hypothetical protein
MLSRSLYREYKRVRRAEFPGKFLLAEMIQKLLFSVYPLNEGGNH